MTHDKVAVVDFGGQYAHLIATKIRRLGVLAEIRQPEDRTDLFAGYRGIVLSGSPSLSAFGEDSTYNKSIYDLDVPILGFCFGHQEIAKHYGGEVVHGGREWGPADLHVMREHPLFSGLERQEPVWMSHFDSVVAVGPDFEELGYTTLGSGEKGHRYAAIGSDRHRRYGFQFHPEVDDTVHGDEMIGNFVLRICGCRPTWSMQQYIDEEIGRLRERIGGRSVFLLASGGVDSTVAAKLLERAIGADRVHLLHIDNGLMRKGESREVLATLKALGLDHHLAFVDASETFLSALEGVVEPEHKRRIIGDTFIDVFERAARRLGLEEHLLAQGTIYPDTIETGGTKRADIIKTHHNRVPIIQQMIEAGRVVEPLAELYKVEVRELGERLGVPRDAIRRHPFPGPGLGVRLLCSAAGHGQREHFDEIEPALAVVSARFDIPAMALPIKSVGVKADLRSYEHPVLLGGECAWERLLEMAATIFKDVPHINRCIWWMGDRPPRSVRPLAAAITRARLDLLREADAVVMDGLRRHGIYDQIWQCPTVFVPAEIDGRGRELVIIRPIRSERAMTATPAPLPPSLMAELTRAILSLDGVSGLALDVTTKPPGTIEWE